MLNLIFLYKDYLSSVLINFLFSQKFNVFFTTYLSANSIEFIDGKFDVFFIVLPSDNSYDFVKLILFLSLLSKPIILLDYLPSHDKKLFVSKFSNFFLYDSPYKFFTFN